MSKSEHIKQQLEEARELEKKQQESIEEAMNTWKNAMDAQYATSVRIAQLYAELREEHQRAFDEDGMLLGT